MWLPLRVMALKILPLQQVSKRYILPWTLNFIVVSVAILVLLLDVIPAIIPFEPLMDIVPQKVTSELHIGGYPAFHYSDKVAVEAVKCNNSDTTVVVRGQSSWVRQGETREVVNTKNASVNRDPGCFTFHFNHVIQSNITPGLWRVEGYDQTISGTRDQIEGWYTDTFLVLP